MRLVFGLVLVAGIGLAGFAVYMAQNYIGAYENALVEERKKTTAAVPTKDIYVLNRSVAYGEQIVPEDVLLTPWPKKILPEGHFDAENPLFNAGDLPRVAMRAMEKFEAATPFKVSDPGGDAGITSRLQGGEQAFAIEVNASSGVSGFLRPGDRVDVYWTGRVRDPSQGPNQGDVSKRIESGLRLLAIDQSASSEIISASVAKTVTVAATPRQVASLALAQSTGELSLSLLSLNGEAVAGAIEVDEMSLLGIEMQQKQAEVKQESCTIKTRKGAKVVEIPIPCNN